MERKVYDYDDEGFAIVTDLLEGTVTRYFAQTDRRYGFILLENGASVFFHMNNARTMGPFGVEKAKWVPRFETSLTGEYITEPRPGDKLVFLARHEKRGLAAREWSTVENYEKAVAGCQVHLELEHQQIQNDPRYRGYPTPKYKQRWTEEVFVDRLLGFNLVFPLDFDPDDTVFEKFERETLTGWEPCEDPRTRTQKSST